MTDRKLQFSATLIVPFTLFTKYLQKEELMNLTTIEKLTASVITNFIAQHFNNEVRHTTLLQA